MARANIPFGGFRYWGSRSGQNIVPNVIQKQVATTYATAIFTGDPVKKVSDDMAHPDLCNACEDAGCDPDGESECSVEPDLDECDDDRRTLRDVVGEYAHRITLPRRRSRQ